MLRTWLITLRLPLLFTGGDDVTVKGIHKDGEILFTEHENKIRYSYSGAELLGYDDLGYDGSFLDVESWLDLTHSSEYPMAPVNIFYFMQNRSAGHIITLLEPGQYNQTGYSSKANHGGFHSSDMLSPMFVKGEAVESLRGRDSFWLPNLFNEFQGFVVDAEPQRDRHYITAHYNVQSGVKVTEFALSPTYRVYYGATLYWDQDLRRDELDIWGQVDLFRSFISRLWMGGGVEAEREGEINPFFKLRYDIHLRKLVLQNYYISNRSFRFKISYEVTPAVAFELENFRSLGLRIDF